MNNIDLPFVAEYAKSGRASCKICKEKIGEGSLRIGVMVQSPHFDGKVPMWHHSSCYLSKKSAIANVTEIANFDNLRWEDQKRIKEQIAKGPTGSKSKGGSAGISDFKIEYARSGRAACRTCNEKIPKDEIRISKLIKDGESARYGPIPGWRHVDCFVKDRLELDYLDSADKLPGFSFLEAEDKKMVQGKIGKLAVKRKAGEGESASEPKKLRKEEILLKTQNELLFEMRDTLKKTLSKKEMVELLEYNDQYVSPGEQNIRDHLSDCLVFGAIKKCPECKSACPRYKIDAYRCPGNLTEWTKCQYVTRCPEREPFKIPNEYKEDYEFLKDYKYVKRDRVLPKKEDTSSVAKGPLQGYIISVFGKLKGTKSAVEKIILELSGAVSQKVDNSVNFCISSEDEVAKNSKKITSAKNLDIHVVSEKFLESVKNGSTVAVAIKENLVCTWGGDPILKFGIKRENEKMQAAAASSSSNSYSSGSSSSKSKTMKVSVKGGAAVDPDSGKENSCHVYEKKGNVYSVVLGSVDISRGMNSYYKLQLLEENKRKCYHLFRSWGRVGTDIGGNKIQKMTSLELALKEFSKIYLDKTGNDWSEHKNFVKKPGRLYPLDIDYGQDMPNVQELKVDSNNCKLPEPVQELICLIFDIEAMKRAMVEFEIDLQKMPLGKLSKKQIEKAYSVLSEAQQIILTGCNATKILDASNRFYTLIPHDFGLKTPPLLDNDELIKSKIEMLDSLLEIEFAYNLIQSDSATKDPVSEHYVKLKTDIDVLEEKSEEFKIIKKYVKNTHAETHGNYDLNLQKVFKINRHGESENYKKFKDLHNKKLLWHGSRLTNFVGILSQGLRIAPPEAPVTGYMFGKGVYFADMVSKSANYCYTSKKNSTGLLLLCEVALGDMSEKLHADDRLTKSHLTKEGKHSTKGLGMTVPNPKDKTFIGDVEVPYGKPVKSDIPHSSLLYNEYIVYDTNQVNIKYLLKVDFKWKY